MSRPAAEIAPINCATPAAMPVDAPVTMAKGLGLRSCQREQPRCIPATCRRIFVFPTLGRWIIGFGRLRRLDGACLHG